MGLGRRFGDFVAVVGFSVHVPDGTVLALLGPNGAGKTTTVRMLSGLLAPSVGRASVAGYDVRREAAAVRARVGLVTDVPGLYEQMTVPAYLDFFGSVYGLSPARRAQRIDELIEFFELQGHRKERMSNFSKGMKQKVALARALLHEPVALFLDEPTSGLDPLSARAVRELVVDLKQTRRSIVLTTHDLDEAERLADQIAIMRRGRIAAYGTPDQLRARATSDVQVRVQLAAPCPPAARVLSHIPGVILAPEAAEAPPSQPITQLTYWTTQPAEVNPRALAALITAGAQVVSVDVGARSLEDIYADAMAEPLDQRIDIRADEEVASATGS